MTRSDIDNIFHKDWFLKNIFNETCFADMDLLKTININEDKNTAMSLIDSMRYNRLIIIPGVSLDYMLALSEKWCCAEFINSSLKELINKNKCSIILNDCKEENINKDNIFKFINQKCINCQTGFNIFTNKEDSCRRHTGIFNEATNRWNCCNKKLDTKYCKIGYHVMSDYNQKLIFNYYENK